MDYHTLIDSLRQRLGLDTLTPDEAGGYTLTFDGMPVYCFKANQFLYLQSEVGTPPSNPQEATGYFQDLLQRNLAHLNQQAAVLCLDEDDNRVLLYRRFPLDSLDIHRLETALEDYLNYLEYWRGATTPMSSPASLAGGMQMFFP